MNKQLNPHTGGWGIRTGLAGDASTLSGLQAQQRRCSGSLARHGDSEVDQGELCGPGRKGTIPVCLQRAWSGSGLGVHGCGRLVEVWQVALIRVAALQRG